MTDHLKLLDSLPQCVCAFVVDDFSITFTNESFRSVFGNKMALVVDIFEGKDRDVFTTSVNSFREGIPRAPAFSSGGF
jgi:hypothetical protein